MQNVQKVNFRELQPIVRSLDHQEVLRLKGEISNLGSNKNGPNLKRPILYLTNGSGKKYLLYLEEHYRLAAIASLGWQRVYAMPVELLEQSEMESIVRRGNQISEEGIDHIFAVEGSKKKISRTDPTPPPYNSWF